MDHSGSSLGIRSDCLRRRVVVSQALIDAREVEELLPWATSAVEIGDDLEDTNLGQVIEVVSDVRLTEAITCAGKDFAELNGRERLPDAIECFHDRHLQWMNQVRNERFPTRKGEGGGALFAVHAGVAEKGGGVKGAADDQSATTTPFTSRPLPGQNPRGHWETKTDRLLGGRHLSSTG